MRSAVGSSVVSRDRTVREHPGVRRRRAALHAYRARVGAAGYAHETARHDLPAFADLGEEQAQRERPRLQAAVAPHRHARQRHRFLRHVVHAAIADRGDQRPALRVVEPVAQKLAGAASVHLRLEGRRDHHAVEPFDHLLAHFVAAEPPRGDVRDRQVGAEHDGRQRRQECQHRARFDQSGAERIDDDDLAVAHGLQKSGCAEPRGGIQFERIGEIGVDAAEQHFGSLQTGYGADKNAVIAHAEVFAFDQHEPEIAREIGVLEIGLAHRSGREQTKVSLVLTAQRRKLGLKRLEERRDALDPRGAVDVGHGA